MVEQQNSRRKHITRAHTHTQTLESLVESNKGTFHQDGEKMGKAQEIVQDLRR